MAVNLSPIGGVAAQFLDNNGNPLTGGKIYTYAAGTTTPQATYTSAGGSTPHSNPIILDAAGRVPGGEIWLTDGLQYKFLIKTSTDVQIGSYDNIIGINSNFVNYTNSQEIQTATAGQTVFTLTTMVYQPGTNSLSVFVDGVNQYGPGALYAYTETSDTVVTFNAGLHVGAEVKFTTSSINASSYGDAEQISYTPPFTSSVPTNVEAKLAQTVSVKDFGAVGNGVADDTTAILAAVDAASAAGTKVFVPAGTYNFTGGTSAGAVRLFGSGTLNITGVFNLAASCSSFELDGITVTAAKTTGFLHQDTGTTIPEARITNVNWTGGSGIKLRAGAANVYMAGCSFNNLSAVSGSVAALQIGANDYADSLLSKYIRIIGNKVTNVSNDSTAETHAFLVYGYDITISDNTVSNVSHPSATSCEAIYVKGVRVSITGNVVSDCSVSEDGYITCKGVAEGVTTSPQGYKVVVSNNVLSNSDTSITPIGVYIGVSNALVSDNNFINTWLRVVGSNNIQVTGNAQKSVCTGILLAFEVQDCSNVTFLNNVFDVQTDADLTTLTGSQIRSTVATTMNNIVVQGGQFIYRAPNCTSGTNSVAPFFIWSQIADINNIVIRDVDVQNITPGILSESDRNVVYAIVSNDVGLKLLNNTFDSAFQALFSITGTLTLKSENNLVPSTLVTVANVGLTTRYTDAFVLGSGMTANRNVVLPNTPVPGISYKFRNDNATYNMVVQVAGGSGNTFSDGTTSKTLAPGASLDVTSYSSGIFHPLNQAGTVT